MNCLLTTSEQLFMVLAFMLIFLFKDFTVLFDLRICTVIVFIRPFILLCSFALFHLIMSSIV